MGATGRGGRRGVDSTVVLGAGRCRPHRASAPRLRPHSHSTQVRCVLRAATTAASRGADSRRPLAARRARHSRLRQARGCSRPQQAALLRSAAPCSPQACCLPGSSGEMKWLTKKKSKPSALQPPACAPPHQLVVGGVVGHVQDAHLAGGGLRGEQEEAQRAHSGVDSACTQRKLRAAAAASPLTPLRLPLPSH